MYDDEGLKTEHFQSAKSIYSYKLCTFLLKDIIKVNKSQIFIDLPRHDFKVSGQ